MKQATNDKKINKHSSHILDKMDEVDKFLTRLNKEKVREHNLSNSLT